MARTRLLHPGFFSNELLTELPFEGRILFAGLWTIADRKGRLEDRPRRIRAELFPYDPISAEAVNEHLDALAERGFIERYEVGGERYILITGFAKNQKPHSREQASRLPGPEGRDEEPFEDENAPYDDEIECNDAKVVPLAPCFDDPRPQSRAVTGFSNRFTVSDPVSDPGTEAEAVSVREDAPGSPPRHSREEMARRIVLAIPKAHRDDPSVLADAVAFADDFPGDFEALDQAQRAVRRDGGIPWPRLLRAHMPARASPRDGFEERRRRFLGETRTVWRDPEAEGETTE